MNFKYLNEIFLPVTDLKESSLWYQEQFGLDISIDPIKTDQNEVILSFKETRFILVKSSEINKYTHIPFNFHTNSIRALHDSLKNAGVTVTRLTDDDGLLCCDFYDPDGNRIGLCDEQNDSPNQLIEVGGVFLTVRNLAKSVEWYEQNLGFQFHYFSATGAAGFIGATPEYAADLTINYAGVENNSFESAWSRMAIVETPSFNPLIHIPYTILSSNAEDDYAALQKKHVKLSGFNKEANKIWFTFEDLDGNSIGIVQEGL